MKPTSHESLLNRTLKKVEAEEWRLRERLLRQALRGSARARALLRQRYRIRAWVFRGQVVV